MLLDELGLTHAYYPVVFCLRMQRTLGAVVWPSAVYAPANTSAHDAWLLFHQPERDAPFGWRANTTLVLELTAGASDSDGDACKRCVRLCEVDRF